MRQLLDMVLCVCVCLQQLLDMVLCVCVSLCGLLDMVFCGHGKYFLSWGLLPYGAIFTVCALKERGQGLVNGHGNGEAEKAFYKSERRIKNNEAFQHAFHLWKDQLVCGEDGFLWHNMVEKRVYDIVIGGYADDAHQQRPGKGSEKGAFLVLPFVVNEAGREDKAGAQEEVGEFANAPGGGDKQVQQVLDKADGGAADRAHGEGSQQRWEIRQIHFDKRWDDRQGKFKKHQDKGKNGEHRCHGKLPDIGLLFLLCRGFAGCGVC